MTNPINLQGFIEYLENHSKSKDTINTYIAGVQHYLSQYPKLSRENIIKYISANKNKYSTATFNNRLSSLKSYNQYLMYANKINSLCIIKEDYIKIQDQGNPCKVTPAIVNKFISRVESKYHHYKSRNIAIVQLLLQTGIRREECTNIRLSDIDLEKNKLRIIGKGKKERTVLINDKAIDAIRNYLIDRDKNKNSDSKYLFLSERGNKLNPNAINDIFETYCTPACHVTPHSLRHYYGSMMAENNILTMPELRNQLGHSSLAITSRYTHAREDIILAKIKKVSL